MNSILEEWLSPPSIAYIAEYLQFCENPEMLSELRAIAPPEALKQATKRLSPNKREQIKQWVVVLNSAREVQS